MVFPVIWTSGMRAQVRPLSDTVTNHNCSIPRHVQFKMLYTAKQHLYAKRAPMPFLNRHSSVFIIVWFDVSCVHRWWETASRFLLCQHWLSPSNTSKSSLSCPFSGQVSRVEHIQVIFSKLWKMLRKWLVFRLHSFWIVYFILFFFSLFAALVMRWSVIWKIISSMSCLLTLRTCIEAQRHCATSDALWALPAKACTGQGFMLLVSTVILNDVAVS